MSSFFTKDLKKRGTPPTIIKSHSTTSTSGDKYRHLEDDVLTLGHMTDLAKTITVPHHVNIFFSFLRLISIKKPLLFFSNWMNH
jgi:hypothetical protein